MPHNLHDTLQEFKLASGATGRFYSLPALEQAGVGRVSRLPVSIRIVLESVLRNCDGKKVTEAHVKELANWAPTGARTDEIPFVVARVVLQDFTGVPLLADLAAMRNVAADMGKNPKAIEPLVPVDLVVDHSVMIDYYRRPDALDLNMKLEFKRNAERYQFMKWGMQAFDTFKVVPPGIGIVHQVNLEYLARGVTHKDGVYYPDTLVGTDSHTTMINGIGVVGWGVGGIEAEAGMLGQPVYFLTPDVVGVELTGKLNEGITATDLVLTVTEMLRREKVVGKFVEFFGEGTASLAGARPRDDRQHGARIRRDDGLLPGRRRDHRLPDAPRAARRRRSMRSRRTSRRRACSACPRPARSTTRRSLKLDLSSIKASVAGPKRPQDRIELGSLKSTFTSSSASPSPRTASRSRGQARGATRREGSGGTAAARRRASRQRQPRDVVEMVDNHPTPIASAPADGVDIGNGDVLIAAITSCTNTSNPGVLLAAGLLAKKAVEKGLTVQPHVKTSLAPGSRVVTDYLTKAGLLPYLEQLGFCVAAYGCTTCIGNAGDLAPEFNEAITDERSRLRGGALGQPQLRGAHPSEPQGEFPRLAAAGRRVRDRRHGAEGPRDRAARQGQGRPGLSQGHLADVARGRRGDELSRRIRRSIARSTATSPTRIRCGARSPAQPGQVYNWPALDVHREAAVLRRLPDDARQDRRRPGRARARHLRRLGDDRPHQPGRLDQADLARRRLSDRERRHRSPTSTATARAAAITK